MPFETEFKFIYHRLPCMHARNKHRKWFTPENLTKMICVVPLRDNHVVVGWDRKESNDLPFACGRLVDYLTYRLLYSIVPEAIDLSFILLTLD